VDSFELSRFGELVQVPADCVGGDAEGFPEGAADDIPAYAAVRSTSSGWQPSPARTCDSSVGQEMVQSFVTKCAAHRVAASCQLGGLVDQMSAHRRPGDRVEPGRFVQSS
jgi:hypothetical protein